MPEIVWGFLIGISVEDSLILLFLFKRAGFDPNRSQTTCFPSSWIVISFGTVDCETGTSTYVSCQCGFYYISYVLDLKFYSH